MTSLQPIFIAGSSAGLRSDVKPFLQPDQAFQKLENAYVWRERVKKREGLRLLGRLRRVFENEPIGNSGVSPWSFNIFTILAITEPNREIQVGSVSIDIGGTVLEDQGNGTLETNPVSGVSGTINYITGAVTITGAGAAIPTTISFGYFPGLPVMGIWQREIPAINEEQTIFFDTVYAYIFSGTGFQEWIPGTTWQGTDADFFWTTNYRGSVPEDRLFFATNFVSDANNPMRYADPAGTTWTTFAPLVSATDTLFQARILIPYYGRLVALNVYEGTTAGGAANAVNIFNRARFSQLGSPIAVDAWRSDLFGKGGFIDAPTNEAIISAAFIKNTLIVFFERSTWQLRYVGEYGLPFLWERISSDFGCESTFSPALFDEGVAAIGDKAIISANANTVNRIDLQVPDLIFDVLNAQEGPVRVHGIRDFKRELVFWNYADWNNLEPSTYFPNRVLVYNYRNNTYAIFRDNVTCFGTFQPDEAITWDSLDIFWDDEGVTWDDPETQNFFPYVVIGNAQGFIHFYGYNTPDEPSLSITAINFAVVPAQLTVPNHNLETGDIIFIGDALLNPEIDPDLNESFYRVTFVDVNTISLSKWNGTNYVDVDFTLTPTTYLGGGKIILFPKLDVQTKDFNPYISQGGQFKLSYIDFLTDATPGAQMTVNLFINSSPAAQANLLVGNTQNETFLPSPYYVPGSNYAWHRFFATTAGQFVNIQVTYDDNLMNDITTHRETWILNAMTLWMRPGGKVVF